MYYSKARGYSSALAAALFPDNVPQAVYDNLIATVRSQLPAVYRYLDVRKQKMKLPDLHHYDTYVTHSRRYGTNAFVGSGDRDCNRFAIAAGRRLLPETAHGLNSGWCDRYPNQGKQSGAFSCGSFEGNPYIMMNYKPTS